MCERGSQKFQCKRAIQLFFAEQSSQSALPPSRFSHVTWNSCKENEIGLNLEVDFDWSAPDQRAIYV